MVAPLTLGELVRSVEGILRTYEQNPFSREVDPRDDMTHPDWDKDFASYFLSGRTALEIVLQGMITSGLTDPGAILDMPSGFGRVTRHLASVSFARAEAGFHAEGFGYVDYNLKAQFFEQDAYGVTLSSPSWVMRCLEADESIRITGFMERRWDECQDVVVFTKTPIHA